MALIQFNLCLCRFSSWNLEMIETMLWIRRLVLLTTIIVFSGLFCKYLLIILGIELETCSHYHYRNQLNGRYKVFTILIKFSRTKCLYLIFFLSDFFVIRFFSGSFYLFLSICLCTLLSNCIDSYALSTYGVPSHMFLCCIINFTIPRIK